MATTATVTAGIPSTEVPGRAPLRGRPFPPWLTFAFLVGLNSVAMAGQTMFFRPLVTNHNGPEDWALPFFIALFIEMIGVYLAGMAHASLMADQSAGLLRLGSYAIGVGVGFLNYWHFCGTPTNPWAPTALALVFGGFSAISPWLWAIYSRYMNRERLTELGVVDKRGVKLSINRKIWHPIKSVRVMSFASWEGITNPDDAVRQWELTRERPDAPTSGVPASSPEPTRTPAEWVQLAEALKAEEPTMTWEQVAREIGCSDRHLRFCRKQVAS